jgi:hypothetical protein
MLDNCLPSTRLTVFHVKVLAALLMATDHIGYVMQNESLRIAGRFSFPLFAWLLVQGSRHTQDWQRYEKRLLILALASQLFYAVFIKSLLPLNTVFQLWLGLVLLRLIQSRQMTALMWVAIIGIATLFFDYHYYGVGLIYLIHSYPLLLPKSFCSLDLRTGVAMWVVAFIALHFYYAQSYPLQLYALPIIILMPLLNTINVRGLKARWFYWFYPLHFVPLLLIRVF